MNVEQARFNMIEQQIRPWEVLDPQVLDLLFVVKREDYTPTAYRALAFADMEIPIGHGQVMLAPKIEARLLQELAVKPTDKVLEVGTGSGYMTALLAARAEHVVSVELNANIAALAKENLGRAGVANVTLEVGSGARGWAGRAPYDVIVLSGSVPQVPAELLAQLRVGGRMAAIVGEAPAMEAQLITCTAEGVYNTVNLFETVVPALQEVAAKSAFEF